MPSERLDVTAEERDRRSGARISPDATDHDDRDGAAFASAPGIAWTTDRTLTITSVSGAGLADLGLSADDLVGSRMLARDVEVVRYPAVAAHRRALGGIPSAFTFRQGDRWYVARVVPLRRDDEILGTIGVSVDATHLGSQAEESATAVQHARDEAELLRTMNKSKEALLGSIVHDLRTPLATILLVAETLDAHGSALTPETVAELHRTIVTNAKRVSRFLVTGIDPLDTLRNPPTARIDIGAVVRTVVEGTRFEGRRVVSDIHPMEVDVDPIAVERVVQNLLANALQHTPPWSPIWVRVVPQGDRALIAVEDAGPGVSDDLKAAIFAPAVHVGGAGTGMGLALVARFAELMGGHAWVEDREGGGASFRVTVPARPPRQESHEHQDARTEPDSVGAAAFLGPLTPPDGAPQGRRGRPRRGHPAGHR